MIVLSVLESAFSEGACGIMLFAPFAAIASVFIFGGMPLYVRALSWLVIYSLPTIAFIMDVSAHVRAISLEVEKYRTIIEDWRKEGYEVSGLERVLRTRDLSKIGSSFNEYSLAIKSLKEMEAELDSIVSQAYSLGLDFSERVSSIRRMLKDPSRLDEARNRISELKDDVAIIRARLEIDLWKEEGYEVSKLEKVLETRDSPRVEPIIKEYESRISRIKKLETELDSLMPTMDSLEVSFEHEASLLRSMLRDPLKLEEAERMFSSLKEDLRILGDFKSKIEIWRREGYNVSGLEELFENREIDSIRNVSDRFEKIVQGIRTLEREANILGLRELEAEVSSLKNRLGDLDRIEEVREYVSQLQRKIGEFKESKRREWEKKIIGWEKRGYEAPVFKKYLTEYSVQAEEKLRKYEEAIGSLKSSKRI